MDNEKTVGLNYESEYNRLLDKYNQLKLQYEILEKDHKELALEHRDISNCYYTMKETINVIFGNNNKLN